VCVFLSLSLSLSLCAWVVSEWVCMRACACVVCVCVTVNSHPPAKALKMAPTSWHTQIKKKKHIPRYHTFSKVSTLLESAPFKSLLHDFYSNYRDYSWECVPCTPRYSSAGGRRTLASARDFFQQPIYNIYLYIYIFKYSYIYIYVYSNIHIYIFI
jgi:hypothetical protein